MSIYARVQGGFVMEIIAPAFDSDGVEVQISDRFTPDIVAMLADVTKENPAPLPGYAAAEANGSWTFGVYVPPAPTATEIVEQNTATMDSLLSQAALSIAPLQDSMDLGIATSAETSLLTAWKQYRVAVNRVDLTAWPAAWPVHP
ncbi:tail fiber assembly protein [Dyella halodurans]|uniref:Tail fiber assembly protein n=1 Tax=Dyella halodurans TaxID=1920171 RepID=A0ABV9C1S5_9GAMM|nr:tail fiber assembly protein [Dyella halodurans]